MKKYLYVFVIFCMFSSCKDEQLPDPPPESPSKSRTFAERLVIDPEVYDMLREHKEFYEVCEQAYNVREMLNITEKDSICILSLNAASKQLNKKYNTLNQQFKIDNIQTYIVDYLKLSISYSKGVNDINNIEGLIIISDMYAAWNTTFLNIKQNMYRYNDPEYEFNNFATYLGGGIRLCVYQYWRNYLFMRTLDSRESTLVMSIFNGCGYRSAPVHELLRDIWMRFVDYYTFFLPPVGAKGYDQGGGGGGGNPTGGGGNPDPSTPKESIVGEGTLFKNENLTQEQIKEFNKAIEKIQNDCLGGPLLNELSNAKISVKMAIDLPVGLDGMCSYSGDKITLKFRSTSIPNFDNLLLHELIHVIQGNDPGKALNSEIEARMVVFRYIKRNGLTPETNTLINTIEQLSNTMNGRFEIDVNSNDEYSFETLYQDVVDELKKKDPYKNYNEDSRYRHFLKVTPLSSYCL